MHEPRFPDPGSLRSHVLDPLVYSSIWMASAAACLAFAAGKAMELPFPTRAGGLIFCGILLVYNLDRLRDLERDRLTSPRRSAFIARYRRLLWGLVLFHLGREPARTRSSTNGPAHCRGRALTRICSSSHQASRLF